MRELSGKQIVCLLTAKFQSRGTARPSLAPGSKTDEPQNGPTYLFGPCAYSSFLPSLVRVILSFFTVHANLCTAIQIYFHDCQVKFKFMSALLFMNVSRA